MPISYYDLSFEPIQDIPLNILLIGSLNKLKEFQNEKIFQINGIFSENALEIITKLSFHLFPSTERGSSIETYIPYENNKLQRVVLCAIPIGLLFLSFFLSFAFLLLFFLFINNNSFILINKVVQDIMLQDVHML